MQVAQWKSGGTRCRARCRRLHSGPRPPGWDTGVHHAHRSTRRGKIRATSGWHPSRRRHRPCAWRPRSSTSRRSRPASAAAVAPLAAARPASTTAMLSAVTALRLRPNIRSTLRFSQCGGGWVALAGGSGFRSFSPVVACRVFLATRANGQESSDGCLSASRGSAASLCQGAGASSAFFRFSAV